MIDFDLTSVELLFLKALGLIAAACLFVPIFRRLKLGAVLGYLAAGLAVQLAFSESFTENPEELLHFAEFGVVLFLFVIGLELKPATLWDMRSDIFGLGFAQVVVCGAVLSLLAYAFGLSVEISIIIGLGLALSSTALVMGLLDERRERGSLHGRKSFAILLFQDLAIVPLLLLVAYLGPEAAGAAISSDGQAPDEMGLGLARLATAVGAITLLILIGRYGLDPMFRLMARTGSQEIMTASALGVVLAAGLMMDLVGLSYAMGAFMAGVMLAESTYRHEVEANIEPFRGLFLGLFFMAVGLSLDLETVADNAWLILAAAPAAMALKAIALYGAARLFKSGHNASARSALILAQHGEFGFVLFGAAATAGLIDAELSSILVAIVSVSMALSPLAMRLEPLITYRVTKDTIDENYDDAHGRTLIIGFGRFGQVVSQPLFARGIDTAILDNDANRVREAQRFGFRVHFGDGARRDVLRAAGADEVELIVVCIDDPDVANQIVALVQSEFTQAKVFVRSFDRRHSIHLKRSKVDFAVRETFESALRLGEHALIAQGIAGTDAARTIEDIRQRDRDRLHQQIEGDAQSGLDRLHVAPVRPEPIKLEKEEEETAPVTGT